MAIKLLAISLISVASVAFAVRLEGVSAYSLEEQKDIVEEHNKHRRGVSPTASNMAELKWDADLAKMAQDVADECKSALLNTAGIGQNAFSSTYKPSVTEPVTNWHDEGNNYNYDNNACDGMCGHYTQVVWATTTSVGCGITECQSQYGGWWELNGWIVVCNYAPRGNVPGQRPYIKGEQCSKCSGKPCKNGLCY